MWLWGCSLQEGTGASAAAVLGLLELELDTIQVLLDTQVLDLLGLGLKYRMGLA